MWQATCRPASGCHTPKFAQHLYIAGTNLRLTATVHHNNPSAPDTVSIINSNTFRELYQRYQPGLFFQAYALLQNQQEAEDIVTDSFMKLWNARAQFNSAGAAVNWMRIATRNACLDLLKHRKIVQHSLNEIAGQADKEWYHEDLLGELLQEIHTAVEQLPEKSREVFRLRYIDGLKNEEIAGQLGIRHQSVRNHLATALKTLRLKLLDKDHLLPILLLMLKLRD
ncbi:RNA polymerase sigma-70 factor (ECF subfamily) [Pseudobacter ginsenosidimutans]|uniref:RNA polymerase sigma-70 factor (ECF subfamily) n=1 Tax=Pseudobacter ginsenosidimutans TaxID=661488 RepID=A0A4Q7MG55_9BACT|nr:RNA polymerase sigma-70 factor (ECF subfamily) [Pseudobacter ginsenosidimutans]